MFTYKISTREKDGGWQYIIAYKDSNGKWRQKAKQGFESSKKAKDAANSYVFDLKKELEEKAELNSDYENITFKEFSDMYIIHKKEHAEFSTVKIVTTSLKKFKTLDNLKMKDIKVLDIQKIIDELIRSKTLKASSISLYTRVMSTMFQSAINQFQIISSNPFKNVVKPKTNKPQKRALTEEEINDLLSKIKNTNYYLISLLAVKCGFRIGEILGLTWEDILEEENKININKQWKEFDDGTFGFGELKSLNSYRKVTMPKVVNIELKKHRAKGNINKDHRLFKYKSTKALAINVASSYRLAGYEISIHELRHTYATLLILKGFKHIEAAKLLGHTTEINIKTYSHLTEDNEKRIENMILENF